MAIHLSGKGSTTHGVTHVNGTDDVPQATEERKGLMPPFSGSSSDALSGAGTWIKPFSSGSVDTPPESPTSSGIPGQWYYDSTSNYFYSCITTDTWVRSEAYDTGSEGGSSPSAIDGFYMIPDGNSNVYRYDATGETWESIGAIQHTPTDILFYQDELYISSDYGTLYKWNGVDTFTAASPALPGEEMINQINLIDGVVYAVTYETGRLFQWNGLDPWTVLAAQKDSTEDMVSVFGYNGEIYGLIRSYCRLMKWNGVDAWDYVTSITPGYRYAKKAMVYNDEIYMVCTDNTKLWKLGDGVWDEVCPEPTDPAQDGLRALEVFNGKLYAASWGDGILFEYTAGDSAWVRRASSFGNFWYPMSLGIYNNELYSGNSNPDSVVKWNGVDSWVSFTPNFFQDGSGIWGLAQPPGASSGSTWTNDYSIYTKDQTDTLLEEKADTIHTHVEANITDLDKYTQNQVDTLLTGKASASHTHSESAITNLDKYTQTEVDTLIESKAGYVEGPITPTTTGTPGQWSWSSDSTSSGYFYKCVAENTWIQIEALNTWLVSGLDTELIMDFYEAKKYRQGYPIVTSTYAIGNINVGWGYYNVLQNDAIQFNVVDLPAVINTAVLRLTAGFKTGGETHDISINIFADVSETPNLPTDSTAFAERARTVTSVNWMLTGLDWTEGVTYDSPDISGVLNELKSHPNYSEANPIVLLCATQTDETTTKVYTVLNDHGLIQLVINEEV